MRTLSTINAILAVICILIGLADSQRATLAADSVTDANTLTTKTAIAVHKPTEMALTFPEDKAVAASRRLRHDF